MPNSQSQYIANFCRFMNTLTTFILRVQGHVSTVALPKFLRPSVEFSTLSLFRIYMQRLLRLPFIGFHQTSFITTLQFDLNFCLFQIRCVFLQYALDCLYLNCAFVLGIVSESTVFSNALVALTVDVGGWIYMHCLIYCLFTFKYLKFRVHLLIIHSFCCRDSLVTPVKVYQQFCEKYLNTDIMLINEISVLADFFPLVFYPTGFFLYIFSHYKQGYVYPKNA